MTIEHVNQARFWAQGDEVDPTLSMVLTAGNVVHVATSIHADGTPTISDSLGNTWVAIGSRDWNSGQEIGVMQWYSVITNGNVAAATITVNFAAPSGLNKTYAKQMSGVDTADVINTSATEADFFGTTTTDAVTSGTLTTDENNCMVSAVLFTTSNVSVTGGTGYTTREFQDRIFAEEKIQATAGATPATWTIGSTTLGSLAAAAFNEAVVASNYSLTVDSAPLTLTGQDVFFQLTVPGTSATLQLTGSNVTLSYTANDDYTMPVTAGALNFAGSSVTLTLNASYTMPITPAALQFTGSEVALATPFASSGGRRRDARARGFRGWIDFKGRA